MKKKLTAIICAICAFVCALSLVACGGGGGGNWSTTGTLNKGNDLVKSVPNKDKDGNVIFDNVEIILATVVSGEDAVPFSQMIQQFNIQYRGKISVESRPTYQDQFDTKVQDQIANRNEAPDFIMSHQMGHKMYLDNKLIQPFDEAMELSGIEHGLDDLAACVAPYSSLGTKNVYSIASDAQSAVVLYNKKLLDECYEGKVPQNRAEMIAASKAAAQLKGITPISVSTRHTSFKDYVFPSAYIQNGGSLYDTDYHASWYDNEANRTAMKKAITSVRELITGTPQLMKDNVSEADRLKAFLNDQALFTIVQPWVVNTFLEQYTDANDIESLQKTMDEYIGATSISKWFAMDATAANADKLFTYSHAFAMTTAVTDINKKAAILEFIKWFTQNTSIAKEWAQAGHISMSKTVDGADAYKNDYFIANYMKKFYPNIDNLMGLGVVPASNLWQQNFGQIMIDVIPNQTNAKDDEIIKKYQDEFNKYLDFVL